MEHHISGVNDDDDFDAGFQSGQIGITCQGHQKKNLKNNHTNQSQILLTENRFLDVNLYKDLIFPFT